MTLLRMLLYSKLLLLLLLLLLLMLLMLRITGWICSGVHHGFGR